MELYLIDNLNLSVLGQLSKKIMNENIKYLEIPDSHDGAKAIIFYALESLPFGMSVETISELAEKEKKIPYVEGKGTPSYLYYPIFAETNK